MKMKIYEELQQGSPEWLEFRQNHIGASDCATIMRMNPWSNPLDLWREKALGWQKPKNAAMQRGNDLEQLARNAYQLEKGILVMPLVAEDLVHPFISASLDGITECLKHGVEIKCGKSSHKLALQGTIPDYYWAQMQQQMYVANLREIDYFSFGEEENVLITVSRDNNFIQEMLEKELKFWDCVVNYTPPED
jgi:putative phage-type endonuclease